MSWYTDFDNRLANYQRAVSKPAETENRFPGWESVAGLDLNSFGLSDNDNSAWGRIKSGGGIALDLLSRPGYAAGGFLNDILGDIVATGEGKQGTEENPFEQAWEGFTGRKKEFFKPASITRPYEEGESGLDTFNRFMIDMIGAVGTDPLSFVPGAAVAKGAQGIGKVTGITKGLEKVKALTRPKLETELREAPLSDPSRLLDSKPAGPDETGIITDPSRMLPARAHPFIERILRPEQPEINGPIIPDAPPFTSPVGATPSPQEIADILTNGNGRIDIPKAPAEATIPPGGVPPQQVPTVPKKVPYEPDEKAQSLIAHLLSGGRVNSVNGATTSGQLYAAKAARAKLNDSLNGIKGRLFGKDDFDNPWRDVEVAKQADLLDEPVEPKLGKAPKEPELELVNPGQKIAQNAIIRGLINSAEDAGDEAAMIALSKAEGNAGKRYYAEDTDKIIVDGKGIGIYEIADKYSGKGLRGLREFASKNPNTKVELFDTEANLRKYDLEMYAKALSGAAPENEIAKLGLMKGDEAVNLLDYGISRREKWAPAQVPYKKKAAYEAELASRETAMSEYEQARRAFMDQKLGIAQTETKRVKGMGSKEWLEQHADKVTEADKKSLRNLINLNNEKGFLKKIDEIMQREGDIDVQTLDALDEAIKAGRVDQEVADELFRSIGAPSFKKAKELIPKLNKRIADLEAKGASLMVDEVIPPATYDLAEITPTPTIKPSELTAVKPDTPMHTATAKALVDELSDVPSGTLTPEVLDITLNSLKRAVGIEFDQGRKVHVHNRKAEGAKGSTPDPYGGSARYLEEYNRWSQVTHFKAVIEEAKKTIPRDPKTGKLARHGDAYGKHMYDHVMPAMKAMDDISRAYGLHPALREGGKGIPLSYYDILSGLPEQWVVRHVFNVGSPRATSVAKGTGRQVTVTQLADFAEASLDLQRGDLSDFVEQILSKGTDLNVENPLINSAYGFASGKAEAVANGRKWRKENPGKEPDNAQLQNWQMQAGKTYNRLITETLGPLYSEEFVDHVARRLEVNRTTAGLQAETFVKKAEYDAVTRFIDDVANAKTQGEVSSMIENARKGVPAFVRDSSPAVPPPGAVDHIADAVAQSVDTNATSEIAQKSRQAHDNAKTNNETVKAFGKTEEAADDMMDTTINSGAHPEFEEVVSNFGGKTPAYRTFIKWNMGPMARTIAAFFPHLGEGKLRQVWLASNNSSTYIANDFSKKLAKWQKQVGTKDDAARIFAAVRDGSVLRSTDVPHAEYLTRVMDEIFDMTNGKNGFMQRNGVKPVMVNEHLKHFGLDPKQFGLKGATRQEAYQSWRDWPELTDPIDTLSKFFQATARAHSEQSFAASISHNWGFAEKHAGEDFVRIPKDVAGSRISHIIDTDLWYPREVAENMLALDKTLRDIAKPPSANEFLRIFDSITHKYKTALTLPRPGHHLRNMYGDVWLNYMDGVRNPKYYDQGRKVLASRKDYYDDILLDTRVGDLRYHPKNTAITMRSKGGGNEVHLTYDDIYSLSVSQGILHDYSTVEDLRRGANAKDTLKTGRSPMRPFDGKVHEKLTGVSEYRDHYVRMAHLMSLLERDKNGLVMLTPLKGEHKEQLLRRSLEDQFLRYSARIRKWHPDGSDLTQFEKGFMRRAVLFYSWIRKSVPLVMEAMLTKPGRFLTYPKAMTTFAEANGIDIESFTDPFPSDQMFPAWMGALQGPQFGQPGQGYMGLRPGVPGIDILEQYFSNPGESFQTLLAGLHPAIKAPFEIVGGKNMQGIPIKDNATYALGQVPFGNIANTTAGWLNGGNKPIGEPSPSNEVYDRLSSGFKDPAAIAWTNMILGLGLMDMSKPSYQKAAEFDVKYGRIAP